MNAPVIVISRSIRDDAEKRAFEDAVVDALRRSAGIDLLVVPEVSHMSEGHPGLDALRALDADLVVYASWLYPRAAWWLLKSLGVEGETSSCEGDCDCRPGDGTRAVRVYRLGDFDSPEAFVMEMPRVVGGESRFTEIRDDVLERWYPVIDDATCTACKQCYDFCLFGVYSLDEAGRPRVTAGDNCKPGCVACSRLCPVGAIMFPHHSGDPGVAGAPGMKPKRSTDAGAIFEQYGTCPVCGAGPDDASEDKAVCPICGRACDRSALRRREDDAGTDDGGHDELDDLIDALDDLDV